MKPKLHGRKLTALAVGGLMVLSFGLAACGGQLQLQPAGTEQATETAQPEAEQEAQGAVGAVDADGGALVIQQESGQEMEFTVSEDTKITMDGEDLALADVPLGAEAEVTYEEGSMTALEVVLQQSEPQEAEGVVASVDASGSIIVIQREGEEKLDLTVNDDTRISMEGEELALADLPPGVKASVTYNQATMTAIEVIAQRPEPKEAQGTVASVDASSSVLVVQGENGRDLELTVNQDTNITMNNETMTLDDVPEGATVKVTYNVVTKTAIEVVVEQGEGEEDVAKAEGVVTSVNLGTGDLTIGGEDVEGLTVHITEDTVILINGEAASLADLASGGSVLVTYDPETHNAVKIEIQLGS